MSHKSRKASSRPGIPVANPDANHGIPHAAGRSRDDEQNLVERIASAVVEQLMRCIHDDGLPVTAEYLSPAQASTLTGIHMKTLERFRGERRGPPYFKVGHLVRYKTCDVRAWVEGGGPVD